MPAGVQAVTDRLCTAAQFVASARIGYPSKPIICKQECFLLSDSWINTDPCDMLGMHLDVPFVPTDERIVDAMLDLAGVDHEDVLFDLGSGDGRIVVAAAHRFGAQAVGVEIDRNRVTMANAYAVQMGVEHQVCFLEGDLFEFDFAPATVVSMYLLHGVNLSLRPRLLTELQPGARIVSHAFDMGDWRPDRKVKVRGSALFLWVVPAQVAGDWQWRDDDGRQYRLALTQHYQEVSGELWIDEQPVPLQRTRLWGDLLELVIQPPGADEPLSLVMHCQPLEWRGVGTHQNGVRVERLAA